VLSADAAFDWAPALAEAAPVLRGVGFISGGRPEEAWLEDARLLQRLLRSYGGGLELWDLGWDPLSIGTGMDAARAFLITSARRAAAGVDRSFYRLQGGEAPSPLHAAEAVWRRLVEGRPYAGRLPWEDGVEAYAFGRGSDMVLIAWSDQPGRRPIPHSDGPVIVADMMGNAALAGPGPDGRAWVEIGPDSVYVIGLPAAARLLVDADALEDLRRSALVEPPEALRSEWERFLERAESVELPPGRPWDAGARRIWRRFESQAGAAEEAAWSLALAAARSLGGEGELSGHRAALHAALRWAMALNRLRGDVGEALQLDLPHEEEAAEARRLKEVLAVRLQERSSGPFAVYAETDRVRAMFEEELAALDWRESPAVQAARSRAAEWLGRIAAALAAQERPYFPGLMVEREDRNGYIARGGDEFAVSATVTSGYGLPAEAALELEPPAGWEAEPGRHTFQTGAVETATLEARFRPVSGERLRSGEMKARLLLEGQVVDSWSFVVIP